MGDTAGPSLGPVSFTQHRVVETCSHSCKLQESIAFGCRHLALVIPALHFIYPHTNIGGLIIEMLYKHPNQVFTWEYEKDLSMCPRMCVHVYTPVHECSHSPMCMCVCHKHAVPRRLEESVPSPGTGSTCSCQPRDVGAGS